MLKARRVCIAYHLDLKRCFILFPFLLLAACSISKPIPEAVLEPALKQESTAKGWWKASYEIAWPDDQAPSWHLDVLLAHRVIAPVLEDYRPAIQLWRFHRRAGRDKAGHRFSFLFYSSPDAAARIFKALRASPVSSRMLSEHRLVRIDYDDPRHNSKPEVQDASDPVWPLMVQKTWPSFIMGASEMWLGLISELSEQLGVNAEPHDEQRYRDVQTQLSRLWREQGQHPLLHHLNALFGYEEMIIINRKGEAMLF
ncbi:MAG: hypothetical protein ACU84H_13065 [Gammaproteobacteria bacterium]